MKEGSHNKTQKVNLTQKIKVDSKRKDMEKSTVYNRIDKFSAGRTKYRSPMLKRIVDL